MGLEAFKKDGPRQYSSDNEKYADTTSDGVHKLKGTEPNTDMVPRDVDVHTVRVLEVMSPSGSAKLNTLYSCSECNIAGGSFTAIVKRQLLDHEDDDWYWDFKDSVTEAADGHSLDEVMDETAVDNRTEEEQEDTSDDNVVTDESGLDAFL